MAYSVGGATQTPLPATPATAVLVDRNINLTITPVYTQTVIPNLTAQLSHFTVSNTGNAPIGVGIDSVCDFPSSAILSGYAMYVDANGNGTFDLGVDNAAPRLNHSVASCTYTLIGDNTKNIGDIAADGTLEVFPLVDVPAGITNALTTYLLLRAVALEPGSAFNATATPIAATAGANTNNGIQTVLSDLDTSGLGGYDGAANNGVYASSIVYAVSAATLVITKITDVIDESSLGAACLLASAAVTNPKAIPGACLELSVKIENTGATAGDNVVLSEDINANLTIAGEASSGSQCTAYDTGVTTAGKITCTLGSIAAGSFKYLKYRANVN